MHPTITLLSQYACLISNEMSRRVLFQVQGWMTEMAVVIRWLWYLEKFVGWGAVLSIWYHRSTQHALWRVLGYWILAVTCSPGNELASLDRGSLLADGRQAHASFMRPLRALKSAVSHPKSLSQNTFPPISSALCAPSSFPGGNHCRSEASLFGAHQKEGHEAQTGCTAEQVRMPALGARSPTVFSRLGMMW